MEEFANLFRRYCLDYGIPLFVIPRSSCIRIVSKVDYDPDIDITIYMEKNARVDNKAANQYHIRFKDEEVVITNYEGACNFISEKYNNLINVR